MKPPPTRFEQYSGQRRPFHARSLVDRQGHRQWRSGKKLSLLDQCNLPGCQGLTPIPCGSLLAIAL
ncbi:hypothetical protein [Pseudomonas phage DVM-2008]|nr:hypothetical protein [Pseudomonas phage DVM-2008]